MSLLQSISDFISSLFGGSSPEAKKRQEVKKIESELREIRPLIYKNEMIQPNFAEALRILSFNLKPIDDILSKTLCTDDLQRNSRFSEQLFVTGFSEEQQATLDSFQYENQLNDAMASDTLAYYFDKKRKELEAIIKQLNAPEFLKIDNTINRLKQLSDLCKFSYPSALRLFDMNYNMLDSDYKPKFQAISPNMLESSLLDLYYIAADLEISQSMAKAIIALYELLHCQPIDERTKDSLIGNLGKIQSVLKNVLSTDILLKLIRVAKCEKDFNPQKATYVLNARQKYAEYLEGRFIANENRLKIEIKDININAEMSELFGDNTVLTLTGYNDETNRLLRQNSTFAFNWIIPMNIIKSFITYFYDDKIKSLLNDIVIEGFFNNPTYKSDFSSSVYACNDAAERMEEFEKKFIRGGQFDQALISGLIRDGHKDNDFVTKLKDLIERINNTAKQFIQTEATNFFDLYVKIGEVLADSKKPTPDTISNLKMLLTSSRNHDSASALEQQHEQWKLFLEIMKNYAIIGSLENKE